MREFLPAAFQEPQVSIELCGFGVVAAGVTTSKLIAQLQPTQVILLGIAGSYCSQLPVGSATCFRQVCCHGIGAGSGDDFKTATSMGFHFVDSPEARIGERLELSWPAKLLDGMPGEKQPTLLTCASASGNKADVARRLALHSDAVAEDMEGYAVALACELSGLTRRYIVRGISNVSGDREHTNWQIDDALRSACDLAARIVTSCEASTQAN